MLDRRTFLKLAAGSVVASGICGLPAPALADEMAEKSTGQVRFTNEVAEDIAARFVASVRPDEGIKVCGSTLFYGESGLPLGYIVDYEKQGNPFGYVVLDKTVPGLLGEFVLEEGAAGFFSSGAGQKLRARADSRIVKMDPLTFACVSEFDGIGVDNYDQNVVVPTTGISRSGMGDFMLNYDDAISNYAIVDGEYLVAFSAISQSQAMEWDAPNYRYACTVVAALNVLDNYGLVEYSGRDLNASADLRLMWSLIQPTATGDGGWSSTTDKIVKGVSSFATTKGKTILSSWNASPTLDQFKRAVSNNQPSVLSALPPEGAGHSVTVEGWLTIATGTLVLSDMLFIADGWHSYGRCVYFDAPWKATDGAFFVYQRPMP